MTMIIANTSRSLISSLERIAISSVSISKASMFDQQRCLSFSRMLDLGGMPSALNSDAPRRRANASKNCKIQAVAFDFDLLVTSIKDQNNNVKKDDTDGGKRRITESSPSSFLGKVKPDMNAVNLVANLLDVDLEGGDEKKKSKKKSHEHDDLSLLTGEISDTKLEKKKKEKKQQESNNPIFSQDIRSKYASRLQKKGLQGGLGELDRASNEVGNTLQKGDAEGHLTARKIVIKNSTSGRRWMAQTGTGKLLANMTHRSMKIALLPGKRNYVEEGTSDFLSMKEFKKQLKDVIFDVLISKDDDDDNNNNPQNIIKRAMNKLEVDPKKIMVVSDRDDYLKVAKDLGMITCRIQPLNARRGNISAHHSIQQIVNVQDVIDETNGISFNAVFNAR